METSKLVLKNVKVLFFHQNDPKFGSTITIDATEPAVAKAIEDFTSANGMNSKIKEHTAEDGTKSNRATIKLASFVKIVDKDLNETNSGLSYGATVSLQVSAYDYEGNFGSGKSASVTHIMVIEPAFNKDDKVFQELVA